MSFWQRFGVGIVTVVMVVSTVALFAGIVITSRNQEKDMANEEADRARLMEMLDEYYAEVDVAAAELSERYLDTFLGWRQELSRQGRFTFNQARVNSLTDVETRDFHVGTGKQITQEVMDEYRELAEVDPDVLTPYSAYYIGWLHDGTVFDSSFRDPEDDSALNFPLAGGVSFIDGWLEGVIGMRIGGVREITIPSSMGYGAVEQGPIPANSGLRFMVMMVEPQRVPEPSEELIELYARFSFMGRAPMKQEDAVA